MRQWLKEVLKVRYIKLRFELKVTERQEFPENKASALRGGMGEMLLRNNCIADRCCDACGFQDECIVQRIMYSRFEKKPEFVTTGESVGYVLECEDYRTVIDAGDTLKFNMILFGRTIVYLNQILQAVHMLGMEGLGKYHAHYTVKTVRNSFNQVIVQDYQVNMKYYRVSTLMDYVQYRMKKDGIQNHIVFRTPVSLKYEGELVKQFSSDAIFAAVFRRLYMLACYEGIDVDRRERLECAPVMLRQYAKPVSVRRFSSTHNSGIYLGGIKGSAEFEELSEELYMALLAGELVHIGKNTSFGFGRYTMEKFYK